jgi:hypothetical protein
VKLETGTLWGIWTTGTIAQIGVGGSPEWVIAASTVTGVIAAGFWFVLRGVWGIKTDLRDHGTRIGLLEDWADAIDKQGCRAHGAEHRTHDGMQRGSGTDIASKLEPEATG